MLSYDNRCKDRSPSDTVRDAREIISKLGLFTSERWFTPISGLYSIHLSVIGTSIYSNGKGSTPEYALASAYGELLERTEFHDTLNTIRPSFLSRLRKTR